MALEEGKMGKKDSDRAEGQYKMQKNQEDPQLARQQAIEQARNAGILSRVDGTGRDSDKGVGFGPGRQDGMPSRLSQVEGAVLEDGRLDVLRALILIAPTAKATKLIETVRDTQGSIAVMHGGKVRPLRLSFMYQGGLSASKGWVEARVSKTGITVEAVPDKSIDVADLKGLAAALDKARKERGTDADAPVDVLVDADVDVQRMVDVLVALDTAGVRLIGLGLAPTVEQLSKRGHRIPAVAMGQPNAQGDLDKAIIRRYVRKSQPQIAECYEKALAVNPDLEGTVQTQFFITPNGNVASSTASGVDPAVANCIGEVIKKIEFPKPQGGGGVQVNYPFTLRP